MLVVTSVDVQLQEAYCAAVGGLLRGLNLLFLLVHLQSPRALFYESEYPVSLAMCVFAVCLVVLSRCKIFHKLCIAVVPSGVRAMLFF
jgi:hypothetical protein